MKIANNMTELVGKTPLVQLNKLSENLPVTLVAKLECNNPCASVKDRIAKNMIETGLADGSITPKTILVEPTSGNTGIGLAFVCAVKGLRLILTMPENMSMERRKLLKAFGAELVLSPAADGMNGAISKAKEIVEQNENALMLMQFENDANPDIHRKTTAKEIWDDTDGKVDIVVAGVGTGGTITGVAEVLKQQKPSLKAVAVEPKSSPVLSGGSAAPHTIQGIGAGFTPGTLNTDIIDEIITIEDDTALKTAKEMILKEGILCGISSGANCAAALELAKRKENAGKMILFVVCDTGERYISTPLFE